MINPAEPGNSVFDAVAAMTQGVGYGRVDNPVDVIFFFT
jgi:hypothetical protein